MPAASLTPVTPRDTMPARPTRPASIGWGCAVWLSACALAGLAGSARADQLVIAGENLPHVKVRSFEQGDVVYRTPDAQSHRAWLGDVDLIQLNDERTFADFNEAERYRRDGNLEPALVRYRRAQRVADGFWADLIQTRLLVVCDETGQIDQTVLSFIRVMRGETTGVSVAARLVPTQYPDRRNAQVVRALEHVQAALVSANEQQRPLLELLRYQILHEAHDAQATELATLVAQRRLPEALRTEPVYLVQLAALTEYLAGDVTPGQLQALDHAIADCPDAVLPRLLVLKGETLYRQATTREDYIRAGWALMRVVIHTPDDPQAARALYGAARVMAQLNRPRQAALLLDECLAHPGLADDTRAEALAWQEELKAQRRAP